MRDFLAQVLAGLLLCAFYTGMGAATVWAANVLGARIEADAFRAFAAGLLWFLLAFNVRIKPAPAPLVIPRNKAPAKK